jgi:hypothetical protein
MPAFDKVVISAYLQAADAASTAAARGKALEDLACYLFGQVPGISITERNVLNKFQTEEIDVACWNDQHPDGLRFINYVILVECKDWPKAVGSNQVSWFLKKIEDRGLDFGVLIAANGITGDAEDGTRAHLLVALALPKKIRMIVITRQEIESFSTTEDMVTLIKRKICQLACAGVIWP